MTTANTTEPRRDSDTVHRLVGRITRCERCDTTPQLKENRVDMYIGGRAKFRVECFCGRAGAWFEARTLAIKDWSIMQRKVVGLNVCPAKASVDKARSGRGVRKTK